MLIRLIRKSLMPESTTGELIINGKFFCFTCEDKVRPGGEKVKGKTAIPPGTYPVIFNVSNRFKSVMPLLLNVNGFEGVRIHIGNTDQDTEGCILVGEMLTVDNKGVLASGKAFVRLLNVMWEAFIREEKIYLTVE